jgi:MFS transporter, FSR family, fosmidomycin resistance protein
LYKLNILEVFGMAGSNVENGGASKGSRTALIEAVEDAGGGRGGEAAGVKGGPAVVGGGTVAALLTLAHFFGDSLNSVLSTLLPTLRDKFGLTEIVLALLVATMWFSSSMMQPVFGALADRFGRRAIGSLGVIANAALLSLVGVVPTIWLLFGVLLVGGFGSAALHPVGTSVARITGGKNKGLAIGLFSAGGMIGFAVGPVVILYVISTFGLGATPWLMVPGVALGTLLWFLLPNDRMPGEVSEAHAHHKIFDSRLFFGPVGVLTVSGILASLSLVNFHSAVPLWLVENRGLAVDSPVIGWTLAAFSLAAGISGTVSGALAGRVSRRLIVPGSMLLATLPLLGLFLFETGSLAFYAAAALAGALVYASLPHMILSAQDLAPQAMGVASGMLMGFTSGVAGVLYVQTRTLTL